MTARERTRCAAIDEVQAVDGHEADGPVRWRTAGALLAAIALIVAVGFTFMGTQVSGILSTVGAPVGIPGQGDPI